MRSQYIWTDRDQNGRRREVRATKFGGLWRFQSKTAGDPDWTYYERPLLEDLLALKEILVRKYQGRRAAPTGRRSAASLAGNNERMEHRPVDRLGQAVRLASVYRYARMVRCGARASRFGGRPWRVVAR